MSEPVDCVLAKLAGVCAVRPVRARVRPHLSESQIRLISEAVDRTAEIVTGASQAHDNAGDRTNPAH